MAFDDLAYEIEYENPKDSMERYYFFLIEFFKDGLGYEVRKTEDVYASSETSSFWGNIEQRKGVQQDKAIQFLGTIGPMVKSMMQLLHDLRIMEQRKELYEGSKKGEKSAEIALKSLWIDLVEGGAQNAKSVYGMAQQVGFVTLPDLFFAVSPKTRDDVDKEVDKVQHVNDQVKTVLRRKLRQYVEWREATEKEVGLRWGFTLKYLRQHFNVIRLYLAWVKPYLKNIQKLQTGSTEENIDIITASEGATVDLEILAVKKSHEHKAPRGLGYKYKKYFPVILIKIHWRTRPFIEYRSEYQRGAAHLGRVDIKFYHEPMTIEAIEEFRKKKEVEDIEVLKSIDASVEALEDELNKRLKQADEVVEEEKAEEEKKDGKKEKKERKKIRTKLKEYLETFGIKMPSLPEKRERKPGAKQKLAEEEEKKMAAGKCRDDTKIAYEVFKKAHRMIQW